MLVKQIPIQVRAVAVSNPVWVVQPSIDFKICMFDRLYQDSITVQSRWVLHNLTHQDITQLVRPIWEVVLGNCFETRQLAISDLLFLNVCCRSKAPEVKWYDLSTTDAVTRKYWNATMTYLISSLCVLQTAVRRGKKVQFSEAFYKSVASCSYSFPKQMHAVTGGQIQGFTTRGGGGHTTFVQSSGYSQHKLKVLSNTFSQGLNRINK